MSDPVDRLYDRLTKHLWHNIGLLKSDLEHALLRAQAKVIDDIPDLGPSTCARCGRHVRRQTHEYRGRLYGPVCVKKMRGF